MHHAKFICLVGIDGAGKTTVSQTFVQNIKDKAQYRYVWGNVQPWIVHTVVTFFRFLKGSQQAGERSREQIKTRRPPWLYAYYAVLLVDYIRHVMMHIAFPLWRGQNVIADRYIYDVVLYIGIKLGWNEQRISDIIGRFQSILPKPSVLFYLDVPADIAFRRKDDVPSLDFLLERQAIFDSLAENYNMIGLDGTQPPEQIALKMIQEIEDEF